MIMMIIIMAVLPMQGNGSDVIGLAEDRENIYGLL